VTWGGVHYEKDEAGNLYDIKKINEAVENPPDPISGVTWDWWRRAVGVPDKSGPGYQGLSKMWNVVYQQGHNLDDPESREVWKTLNRDQRKLVANAMLKAGTLTQQAREKGK